MVMYALDSICQAIINHGLLPFLLSLLIQNHKESIKKDACWIISNIVVGNRERIQAVIEAGLIAPLVNLLQNAELAIKKEAACALRNATSDGTHEQIKYLVSHGCIKPLCDLLVCPDPKIVSVCLDGLENFLKSHDNKEIYEKAVKILETYWLEDVDETLPLGHGRLDPNSKRKIVRYYSLATPWRARVRLESEFGGELSGSP
ncbi:armadillo/beta-catenin-like repeat protein [Medicago truncatula]|uniref:Armadillo/beta-catenin-like repeat protein n=1 Tax=Medicago truncatula TaxID=3880 RepID=A0A072V3B7_MEDTR|nr:armadillo/beta-catenin-like repeat protein [Medicago truncatula]